MGLPYCLTKKDIMIDYIELLKTHNLKATFQRMNIIEIVDKNGHIDIDGIYEQIKQKLPTISLATVYKNILSMTQSGVLVEVPIVGKKSKYELKKADHIHLVCTSSCSQEHKYNIDITNQAIHSLTDKEQFNLSTRQINLYGICKNCKKAS
jgi:Fur family ferric uptake transcriptional regulator/Fur family peroxide stress response transcriptional regulator